MKKLLLILIPIFLIIGGMGMHHYSQDTTSQNWMEHVQKTFGGEKSAMHEMMEKEGMGDMMKNMPCHQMGGKWMGNCDKDPLGNVIPPMDGQAKPGSCAADGPGCMQMNDKKGMGEMGGIKMGEDSDQETFHHSDEEISEFPKVEPTKLVKLKDGDTFEMTAEMVQQEVGNRTIKRLAYNRQIPGPIIEVEKNAKIKVVLTNKLDVNTTLHSHGLRLDNDAFDGLPDTMGGAQPEMKPGDSFTYELNFPDAGVFWYHPHIREDYTQEMGLYGNYHVTEENYWNDIDREEFLVLDDFSENDPFYKDLTNKTLMGRFGNILLINNSENYQLKVKQGESVRMYVTNTANTRTFDFKISEKKMRVVGGDIGRVEKEFEADNFIIAPAERYIVEVLFDESGTFDIEHRGKKIGEIIVSGDDNFIGRDKSTPLRENASDYAIIRDNFQKFLGQKIDKKLRISIGMKGMEMGGGTEEMRMGQDHKNGKGEMMGGMPEDMDKKDKVNDAVRENALGQKSLGGEGVKHEEEGGIEWEDAMANMNKMTNDKMMEWMLIDETNPENIRKNMAIDWTFKKDQFVKIEIFNDPESMHPMQHPIHFHGQRFVVLTRDGTQNDNLQWKDTTLLKNGEKIEILLQTTNPGKWMTHCHIAEHLHAGMMLNFVVEE